MKKFTPAKTTLTAALAAIALSGAMLPSLALAQAAPAASAAVTATAGAKVYGSDGAEVGTVEKVEGGNVVVSTGTARATLPGNAFGKNEKGLLISMTKAQLEAAVTAAEAKTAASIDSALVAGAAIASSDGQPVGKVQKVEGENVIVDTSAGSAITLKKNYLTADSAGALKLTMKAADFNAAVAAAAGAAGQASADAGAKPGSDNAAAEAPASGD